MISQRGKGLAPAGRRRQGDRPVRSAVDTTLVGWFCKAWASAALLALGAPVYGAEGSSPPVMIVHDGDQLRIPADSPLRSRLAVATVGAASVPHQVSFPGVVEADPARTVNILAPLTGQLVALSAKLGDVVRPRQLLATLSSPDLAQAFDDWEKARDALHLADLAVTRAQGVNEAGANAIKDLEQATSNQLQARAELTRADARLKMLGFSHPDSPASRVLEIRSPVAGVVTALNVGVGGYVNDPTAPLMTVADLSRVFVSANIPEAAATVVTRGLAADVTLPGLPDQVLHGQVAFVGAVLDPDTRRTAARVPFPNPDLRLKPNMYATVSFAIPQASQPTVPPSALLMNNDSVTVFVETTPWVFVRRVVDIGTEDSDVVRIRSGLKAGERIVVRGGVLLND